MTDLLCTCGHPRQDHTVFAGRLVAPCAQCGCMEFTLRKSCLNPLHRVRSLRNAPGAERTLRAVRLHGELVDSLERLAKGPVMFPSNVPDRPITRLALELLAQAKAVMLAPADHDGETLDAAIALLAAEIIALGECPAKALAQAIVDYWKRYKIPF